MYPNQLVAERTNAIPCQYKGINFRSLLEARWAYFFDKLGWTWQYEPFEMDGYIPDFMLTHHLPFFVDIKPHTASDYKESVCNKVKEWNDKFVTDYKELRYPVLFFNTVDFFNLPLFDRPNSDLYQVCSLGDHQILVPEYICGNKAFIAENNVSSYDWYCGKLINADGYNSDTVYKLPDDRLILKKDYDLFIEKLRKYWAEAQNATQYKPKTPQQFIEIKQANEFEASSKNVSLKNVASYKQANQLAKYNLLFDVFNVFDVLDEKKITTLWEQVLDKLEPLTTRTLLRQHGSLFNIKGQNIYLKLSTEQLLKMARLRLPNIEKAFYDVLGYSVQVHLQTDAITAPKDVDNTSIVSVEATPVKEENNKNQENNYYDRLKSFFKITI